MSAITRIRESIVKPKSQEAIASKLTKEVPSDTLKTLNEVIQKNGDLSTSESLEIKTLKARNQYSEVHNKYIDMLSSEENPESYKPLITFNREQLAKKNEAMNSLLQFAKKVDLTALRTLRASNPKAYKETVDTLIEKNKYPQELASVLHFLAATSSTSAKPDELIALQMTTAAQAKANAKVSTDLDNEQVFAAIPEEAL